MVLFASATATTLHSFSPQQPARLDLRRPSYMGIPEHRLRPDD
jgi:hypothetical protein